MSSASNFQDFAFVDSPPPRIQRTDGKKPKLVFLSSSEDEKEKVVAKSASSNDSSPWIEAIDHNNAAIQRALQKPIVFHGSRTQLMRNTAVLQNPIPKRDLGYVYRPPEPRYEPSVTVDMRAILSAPKKDSILDQVMAGDYDPVHAARERVNQQNVLVREQRVHKREEMHSTNTTNINNAKRRRILLDSDDDEEGGNPPPASSNNSNVHNAAPRRQKVISLDSDEESPVKQKEVASKPRAEEKAAKKKKDQRIIDSDDEYHGNDELTKAELKHKAADVIKHCELVSKNLRASLKEWEGNQAAAAAGDCINLTSIQASSSMGVLNDADIDEICPGLVLNNYQLVGVNWLRLLYINNVNGVLADDMGLGKTVQTIAFLAWLTLREKRTSKSRKPHLVVVPASTLSNWENELEKFCPELNVVKYHGSQNERVELRSMLREQIADNEVDIILSTYTIFEREASKADRSFIYNQKFDFLVLDEAHCIKNAESSRYTNMNAIRSSHRLLLSGTPVQNDLSELLALLSFLMPSVFGKEDCNLMMEAYGWDKASKASNKDLNQLKVMLAPFVLRRLKRDVLDQLSDKTTSLQLLEMSKMQKNVYEGIIHQYAAKKELLKVKYQADTDLQKILDGKILKKRTRTEDGAEKGSRAAVVDLCSPPSSSSSSRLPTEEEEVTEIDLATKVSKDEEEEVVEEIRALSATDAKHLFTALRKAANHPLLLRVHYTDEKVVNKIATMAFHGGYFGEQCTFQRVKSEIEGFSDYDIHNLCLQFYESLGDLQLDATTLYNSPKMEYLRQLLPKLQREGHRMLLFSQWTRLLDLLEVLLQDMGMSFLRLDGSTPIAARQELIDTYNTDTSIPVFLLSTKAGGLGINLTAADTVILHDLDFNPENDKQAEDRCHRIGQTRPVTIYKLVAKGTVDEDIYEMGERKRELSQAVLSDHRSPDTKQKKKEGDDDMNMISRILSKALSRTLLAEK